MKGNDALPKVFAIADLHLPGGTGKTMDQFGTEWINHVQKIKENWQAKVKQEDIVLIPGDISWAMRLPEVQKDLELIGSWPGTKVLIKGNHDYWWQGIGKVRQMLPPNVYALQNDSLTLQGWNICGTRGWKSLGNDDFTAEDEKIYQRELGRLELSLQSAQGRSGKIVVMLHYPPFNERRESSGFVSLMKKYGVDKCIYGHLHGQGGKTATVGWIDGIDYYLVACDQIDFDPLLIGNIK